MPRHVLASRARPTVAAAFSACEHALHAEPDRQESIVIPARAKELDASGQASDVRSRWQGKAAHPLCLHIARYTSVSNAWNVGTDFTSKNGRICVA
jgi:hypothetical protein